MNRGLPNLAVCAAMFSALAVAQRPASPEPERSAPSSAAPIDLTGLWVSPIMEDWRWRMVTPLKGDAASIPVLASTRAAIDAWDPAKDQAAGEECKAYGAPGLLRLPGRLRITWQDERTLKIETDTGMQTRLLHFDEPPPANTAPSRQGYSTASWNLGPGRGGPAGVPGLGLAPRAPTQNRTLEVTTTHLLPGYLRKNGIPYSAMATLTEYFDRFSEPDGTQWFTVTTVVTDPVYLGMPFVTTTDFRREPNDSGWSPTPCSAR
jgi:hypothetical protein